MKKFESLENQNISLNEDKISEYWDKINILDESIKLRKDSKNFVFYDGPATANNMPKIHHMLAKILKDTFCKYKTMKGYKVLRKAGWDTQGLPVELEVEKELGFTNKGQIEEYGIEAFNKKCRESVWKNEKAFSDFTKKMGQFIDLDHPYVTYDNDYLETIWWILDQFNKKGLIYEGHKILPYCTRCGTGLASHEVAQGYKEITANTVIVPMKLKDKDEYFLVWTTTPWTLISNVALAVNPKMTYIKVESKGYKFILASSLADKVLGEGYKVLETMEGKDLEYVEYEQLMPFLCVDKKGFYVTLADYVSDSDGTGIVHIAPAFGADDYEVGKNYDLPFLNPVLENGCYSTGPWEGMKVFDADLEVIKWLKENDKLFKKEKIKHNYPHCWRCKTPLLYYAKPSYYIKVTDYKDKMIEENKKVNWYPDFVGEKRFDNWLENLQDWAISRNRYWGTPLNIWKCSCGNSISVASRKELAQLAIEDIDENIELHRPYVDQIHIKCSKCGKEMSRVSDVVDVWFDSGAMPFAQYHYPFENKELFESQFPADFISEGVDQTRGWFYSLLAISTFVKGKSPYKNVLVNDMLLDKYGYKMSKSRGNGIDPFELIDKYGADNIRWYLLYVSPVWTPTKFDEEGLKEVYSKFYSTLKNTYNFFALYANTDKVDPKEFYCEIKDRDMIDKWLLSKYNTLVLNVTNAFEEYDLTKAVRMITDFVSDDLSNWYIRRTRRRFWASELDNSKKSVYNTTYEVLESLSRLIAPIVPFISEEMYRKLTNEKSVHLADYPVCNKKLINEEITEKMDLVRDLISLGRFAREDAKVKVRQPIKEILIDAKYKNIIGDLEDLIKEELNVKEIVYKTDLTEYIDFNIKPNFKVCGKMFGKNIGEYSKVLNELTIDQINDLNNDKEITVKFMNEDLTITKDMTDIRISSKEGFNIKQENNKFIILNAKLDNELIMEGIAREIISKIQNMRKAHDFEVMDKINIKYNTKDKLVIDSVNKYAKFINKETVSNSIELVSDNLDANDINGYEVMLDVEKM